MRYEKTKLAILYELIVQFIYSIMTVKKFFPHFGTIPLNIGYQLV